MKKCISGFKGCWHQFVILLRSITSDGLLTNYKRNFEDFQSKLSSKLIQKHQELFLFRSEELEEDQSFLETLELPKSILARNGLLKGTRSEQRQIF